MGVQMRLHELKKGAKIYESVGSMVGKIWKGTDPETDPVIFDHVDGMYSYCYLQSDPTIVAHISATAPMMEYKDGYKIAAHTATDHKEVRHDASINRA